MKNRQNFLFGLVVFIFLILPIVLVLIFDIQPQNDSRNKSLISQEDIANVQASFANNPTNNQIKLNLDINTIMEYNNHCGNEWNYYYKINGQSVHDGQTLTFDEGEVISIYTAIVERDDSYDDWTEYTCDLDLSEYNICTITMTVVENGGTKYPNASAGFTVKYTFTKIN